MKRIASFSVNHNKLKKGIYVSRIDGDVVTYDVRCKIPNGGDYLECPAMHTFEHLFATYARNSEFQDSVIYVGPMGCRTGFYLLLRDNVSRENAIKLTYEAFKFTAEFEGTIPGSTKIECGNYLEHDLEGAKAVAKDMMTVLDGYTAEMMIYEE
jgi:S-ribosylhomocysteine lyase